MKQTEAETQLIPWSRGNR